MRLAFAQTNSVVGALDGNRDLILSRLEEARGQGAELVLFPELAVTGYPPEDLLLRPGFVRAAAQTLGEIATQARDVVALVGFPHFDADLYNACAVCAGGEVKAIYRKRFLPNYGVFDEDRYFAPGRDLVLLQIGETLVGLTICEDMWQPGPPATDLALAGAELLVNLSASPFHVGKEIEREEMFVTRARDNSCFVAFCNAVGGQDELVFDGHSCVLDDEGAVVGRAAGFEESLLVVDIQPKGVIGRRLRDVRRRALAREREATPTVQVVRIDAVRPPGTNGGRGKAPTIPFEPELDQMRLALELGLRDYVRKNGFGDVVVGVSGGIDSAVTVALAVEALGSEHVHCVSMPSRYSSEATRSDARRLADNLGCDFRELSIEAVVDSFAEALRREFAGTETDLTEENLQSRIRGTILMALSNKFGHLVLATGNKSEMATGYSTLYGDMAGGFAVLKDVPKTLVYELSGWRNASGPTAIPERVFTKPPTAELRPGQLDTDSLPPYEQLDPILHAYVEEDRPVSQIIKMGFPADVVHRVAELVDRSEYKRRQAAPSVKITARAFGQDRRLPITNWFREWTRPTPARGAP